MATYVMKRRYFDHGTFSEFTYKGDVICVTAEKPYINNEPNISCVPPGVYNLTPHDSPRFGYCYILESKTLGVGHYHGLRTHILIHKGNTPSDVQGCIVPGTGFGVVNREWAVVNSIQAFNELITELAGEDHTLIIEKA